MSIKGPLCNLLNYMNRVRSSLLIFFGGGGNFGGIELWCASRERNVSREDSLIAGGAERSAWDIR